MSFAIRVDNLGKRYRLGLTHAGSIRELVNRTWKRLLGRQESLLPHEHAEMQALAERQVAEDGTFWALRDVSFEVQPGEVVGIIGRNGSGKSTLLKILSEITAPTTGRVELHGRVASLLEVGTGFHPELSGRENVFLNGAILGMTKSEIRRKFDEIVAFAEIEQFIDTPVKRYSSGMYVRLAFAIAAHLEPEILVVDEVLAVGDGSFQKKCLGKMEDVRKQGRTILFVSHNMAAVTRLCPQSAHLDNGYLVKIGSSHQVIGAYLRGGFGTCALREWADPRSAPGNEIARLRAVRIRGGEGTISDVADIREPIVLEMEFDVLQSGHILTPNFHVYNEDGICVFISNDLDPAWQQRSRPVGRFMSQAHIPGNFLAEGSFLIGAAVSTLDPVTIHCWEPDVVAVQVVDSLDGDSVRGDYAGHYPGIIRPALRWTNTYLGDAVTGLTDATMADDAKAVILAGTEVIARQDQKDHE